jgi:serine/threonine protein phosphatase PrpC
VCDGHGVNGHLASQFIKKNLPINIEHFLKVKNAHTDSNNNGALIKSCLTSAFLKADRELLDSGIDVTFSGSTCVLCYINNDIIYCANLGDSRAIIVDY